MRRYSSRNRLGSDPGSFDLLLDTMCNTFGGIVFIALLLSILSQSLEIKKEYDIAENQPPDILKKAIQKKVEQVKFNISLEEEIEQLVKNIRTDRQLLVSAKESIKDLENRVRVLNQEITASEKQKQRELRLPKLHLIKKTPVFFAIRQDKFYAITDIAYAIADVSKNTRIDRGYDTSDVFVRKYKNVINIEPLSGKGQEIIKGAENTGKIHQAILNINPAKEFIAFAVYPDSFAGFNYVKNIFVKRGFDYNWFIITDQLSIVKGSGQVHAQ